MHCNNVKSGTIKAVQISANHKEVAFRPSPNFENMKKFLKSRSQNLAPNLSPTQDSSDSQMSLDGKSEANPPLPQGPPPPQSPPTLNEVVIKRSPPSPQSYPTSPVYTEVMNIKQELHEEEPSSSADNEPPSNGESLAVQLENLKPLCRDFVRESCKRMPCHFRHRVDVKIDREDLKKVYSFCHNFQNFVCVNPKCKYVHATTFEEQRFYKTAVLPEACKKRKQTLALQTPPIVNPLQPVHSTTPFVLGPPPPPPPPPAQIDSKIVTSSNDVRSFGPSPTPYQNGKEGNCTSPSGKRTWSDIDDGGVQEAKLLRISDCESCQVTENRMKYTNSQIEKLNKSLAETKLKFKLLEKKYKDLISVLEYAVSISNMQMGDYGQQGTMATQFQLANAQW